MDEIIYKFDKLNLSDNYQSSYPYKRINHFNEIMDQARPTIPRAVYDKIVDKINEHTSIDDLKEIFKKQNFGEYYRRSQLYLTNNHFPMSKETIDKLTSMFQEVNRVYNDCKPVASMNFISYNYIVRKCLEILGLHQHLYQFPPMKSKDKLINNDIIWKRICEKLKWEFIASV
jgi:hypothetical protein